MSNKPDYKNLVPESMIAEPSAAALCAIGSYISGKK